MKTLGNTDVNGAHKNVPDIEVFGNGDTFELVCKASSEKEGWMKSTKAMEVKKVGCVVQITTQQENHIYDEEGKHLGFRGYSIAEALAFVPGVRIERTTDGDSGVVIDRRLVAIEK